MTVVVCSSTLENLFLRARALPKILSGSLVRFRINAKFKYGYMVHINNLHVFNSDFMGPKFISYGAFCVWAFIKLGDLRLFDFETVLQVTVAHVISVLAQMHSDMVIL